jgi:hypothetical protein
VNIAIAPIEGRGWACVMNVLYTYVLYVCVSKMSSGSAMLIR